MPWCGIKKAPAIAGAFQSSLNELRSLDVGSLLAFRALRDFELNFLTFFKGLEAVHLNCREVCKQIFTAVVRSDKAEAFRIVEPLDCTCCHKSIFQLKTITRAVKARSLARSKCPQPPLNLPPSY